MQVINTISEIGQTYPQSNANDNNNFSTLKCRFHKNQDILYLNTNIQGKTMLCCQLCVISEELESKKLLPLKALKSEGALIQYIWSLKENKEALKNYQQIKNINFLEEREKIIKQCKSLRVKLDAQIEQLENELMQYNEMLQNYLINIQQASNSFYEQISTQMNQYKTNDIGLDNKMRGYLLDFELNKNKIFEQLNNAQSIIDKGPIKIVLNYEKQIEEFQVQLNQSKENYEQLQKSQLIYLSKNHKLFGDSYQKILAEHEIFKNNEENLFNQQLISICQGCQQTTIEVSQQKKYITFQKNYKEDITINIFLNSKKSQNPIYQLKVPLQNCTQQEIRQIVHQQFKSELDIQQLIVVINGEIVEHNEIIDIKKIESLQVFQTSDQQLNKDETIIFQLQICKTKDNISSDLQNRKLQITNTKPEQTRYIQINKQKQESDLEFSILKLLAFGIQKIFEQNRWNFSHYSIPDIQNLTQSDINKMKLCCSIFNQSGDYLGKNTESLLNLIVNQNQVQKVHIFFKEEYYQSLSLIYEEIKATSDVIKTLDTINLNRSMNIYEDQRLEDYSLLCSNCQSIKQQIIKQQYNIDTNFLIFDISNFQLVQNEFKNLLIFEKNNNQYQLSLCLVKNLQEKFQFLKYDQDSNIWRIDNDQTSVQQEEILQNLIPQILIYQKQEQQQQQQQQKQQDTEEQEISE